MRDKNVGSGLDLSSRVALCTRQRIICIRTNHICSFLEVFFGVYVIRCERSLGFLREDFEQLISSIVGRFQHDTQLLQTASLQQCGHGENSTLWSPDESCGN